MPGSTRTIERNSLSFANSAQRTYTIPSRLSANFDDTSEVGTTSSQINQRRSSDVPKKYNVPSRYLSALSVTQTSRRSTNNNDGNNKSSTNEKNNSQQRQSPPPTKPKCSLPASGTQAGYVTPSKLFNIMGYGLENQYLFMHAHFLYIIDCRSREKFNESHIITGKT